MCDKTYIHPYPTLLGSCVVIKNLREPNKTMNTQKQEQIIVGKEYVSYNGTVVTVNKLCAENGDVIVYYYHPALQDRSMPQSHFLREYTLIDKIEFARGQVYQHDDITRVITSVDDHGITYLSSANNYQILFTGSGDNRYSTFRKNELIPKPEHLSTEYPYLIHNCNVILTIKCKSNFFSADKYTSVVTYFSSYDKFETAFTRTDEDFNNLIV